MILDFEVTLVPLRKFPTRTFLTRNFQRDMYNYKVQQRTYVHHSPIQKIEIFNNAKKKTQSEDRQ